MLGRVLSLKALKPFFLSSALSCSCAVLLSAYATGCAHGAAESSPAMAPEPEPQTIEEAQEQIARAKAQLDSSPMAYAQQGAGDVPASNTPMGGTPRAEQSAPAPASPAPASVPPPPPPASAPSVPPARAPVSKPMPSESSSESVPSGSKSSESYHANKSAPDPCSTPCRALTSMRRAVEAICRLAGNADARCTDAQKTLAASEQRVASCRCP
ncbi:hypothetical protein [Pendulispora albinea]|uniref:Uncharacterized protein n=1 Tax=Pendulispora albinea TaxID=2741071 RepID=A0ABZ2LZ39_9BACT